MGNTIKYKGKGYSDLCLRRDNGECDRRCLPVYFNFDETTLKSNFGKHPQGDITFPVEYSSYLDEYIPKKTLFRSPKTTVISLNSSEFRKKKRTFRTFLSRKKKKKKNKKGK